MRKSGLRAGMPITVKKHTPGGTASIREFVGEWLKEGILGVSVGGQGRH